MKEIQHVSNCAGAIVLHFFLVDEKVAASHPSPSSRAPARLEWYDGPRASCCSITLGRSRGTPTFSMRPRGMPHKKRPRRSGAWSLE